MKYEVARKEFITAEERSKEIFAEEISGSVSAVFTDTAKSSVLAVCGLKFYVPIAEKIAVLLETVELYAKNWLDETCIKDFQTKTGHLGNGYGLGCMVLMDKKPRNYKCTPGVFGWGGMAGTKVVMDLKNKLSFYYSQEVEGGVECAYEEHQHNVITNMLYEILGLD